MLKSLSGANTQTLNYYLARVREIAALGEEAAVIGRSALRRG